MTTEDEIRTIVAGFIAEPGEEGYRPIGLEEEIEVSVSVSDYRALRRLLGLPDHDDE